MAIQFFLVNFYLNTSNGCKKINMIYIS